MKVLEKIGQIGMLAALVQQPTTIPRVEPVQPVGLQQLAFTVIGWLLILAGVVAVLFLIFGGFLYLTAGGNAEAVTKAKTTIVNAVIGVVVIALAYAIYIGVQRLLQGIT